MAEKIPLFLLVLQLFLEDHPGASNMIAGQTTTHNYRSETMKSKLENIT